MRLTCIWWRWRESNEVPILLISIDIYFLTRICTDIYTVKDSQQSSHHSQPIQTPSMMGHPSILEHIDATVPLSLSESDNVVKGLTKSINKEITIPILRNCKNPLQTSFITSKTKDKIKKPVSSVSVISITHYLKVVSK